MATYEPIKLIRQDIERRFRETVFIAQVTNINKHYFTGDITYAGSTATGAIFLDDVNIADMNDGDLVICLRVLGRNYIIGGISPTSSARNTHKIFGNLVIGGTAYTLGIPTYREYSYDVISEVTYLEDPITYTYGTISYYAEVISDVSEDLYAGEIRRNGRDVYIYASSYSAGFPWEFVKSDDTRFIQNIPVKKLTPLVNQVLAFSSNGFWEPTSINTVVEGTSIKSTGVSVNKLLAADGSGGSRWQYPIVGGNDTAGYQEMSGTSYANTSASFSLVLLTTCDVYITAGIKFWSGDTAGGHTAYVAVYNGSSDVEERSANTDGGYPYENTSWNIKVTGLAAGTYTFALRAKTQSGSSVKVTWQSISAIAFPA